MSAPFVLALARREGRASWRRLVGYMGAVALGVAAIVALGSFRQRFADSLDAEARTLLGADLRLESSRPFPDPVRALVDSLAAGGMRTGEVTRFASMVVAQPGGRSRLLQVRAVTGPYPFYGRVATEPPGAWQRFRDGRLALVDPAVLVQLGARVGDTLAIGRARFAIQGTVLNLPAELGFQAAIGPRVYISAAHLEETGLIRVGSLVRYQIYLEFPHEDSVASFTGRYAPLLDANLVDHDTPEEQVERMTGAVAAFTRFLGLVGLVALLLGGVGVASAVHAFVRRRLTTVAVLRCLGASRRTVFTAYLLQAGAMAFCGAVAGVALGLLAFALVPRVLDSGLPVTPSFAVEPAPIAAGLATGVWVAGVFALLPLLRLRQVTPLQALRREVEEPERRRDPLRVAALGALAATVVLLSVWQAPRAQAGLAFAAAIFAVAGLLALAARALAHLARRWFPTRAGYVMRQGVANLFRPHNQTLAVTLALGFGVFLVATLHVVQHSLLARFSVEADPERPNLVLFDLQRDQVEQAAAVFRGRGVRLQRLTPIVPARIARVNGRPVGDLLADTSDSRPVTWALRREYRNTYRDKLVRAEELVAGRWWQPRERRASDDAGRGLARISVEVELAGDLRLGVGDRITWDVQGVAVESEIVNLRRVDWARFEPNFFVVFERGVLEDAPQTFVALARVPDARARAEMQGEVVRRLPNVSVLDLAVVQEALDAILGKITLAVRLMALIGIAAGILVLAGAVSTSQAQRQRESALLRTLGARARQVRGILVAEYAALGAIAALAGILCGAAAGWVVVRFFFQVEFRASPLPLAAVWVGVALLTVGVGVLGARRVVRRTPLEVLRETAE